METFKAHRGHCASKVKTTVLKTSMAIQISKCWMMSRLSFFLNFLQQEWWRSIFHSLLFDGDTFSSAINVLGFLSGTILQFRLREMLEFFSNFQRYGWIISGIISTKSSHSSHNLGCLLLLQKTQVLMNIIPSLSAEINNVVRKFRTDKVVRLWEQY